MKKLMNLFHFILIISSLLFNQAFSHHKNGEEKVTKENIGLEKKDIQNRYCTKKVSKINMVTETAGETNENDLGELDFLTNTWNVKHYHETKAIILEKIIRVKPIKGKPSTNWRFNADSKLDDILKTYCINSSDKAASYTHDKEIFRKIREFNNLKSGSSGIGQELFDNGIKIPEELGPLVYYIPDYLIKETNKQKLKEKQDQETKKESVKEKKWINENKPGILKKAQEVKAKQDDAIISITGELDNVKKNISELQSSYKNIGNSVKKLFEIGSIQNKSNKEVSDVYDELYDLKEEYFPDSSQIKNLLIDIEKISKKIDGLKSTSNYKGIINLISGIKTSNSKKQLENNEKNIDVLNDVNTKSIQDNLKKTEKEIEDYSKIILNIEELRSKVIELDRSVGSGINYFNLAFYILGFVLLIGIGAYIYFQQKKLSSLSSATDSAGRKFSELEGQLKSTSEKLQSVASSSRSSSSQSTTPTQSIEKPKTPEEIIAYKFDELVSDYKDAIDNFSKVAAFKQKWNGLALSRKERQDGTKTILINSSRAFEKSEIWCLNFDDKYFAFLGSTVKTNMAAYMNLDFDKAQRDFKGVFSITSGSSYTTEPSVLRRGGAGFIVERLGKLTFPQ